MSLADDIDVLRRVPLFSDLTDEQLRLLAFSGERGTMTAGETLASAGEAADGGFVVLSGMVALTPGAGFPGRPESLGPGGLLNAPALITAAAHPFTATCLADGDGLLIRRAVFLRLLSEFPAVAQRLHAELARRLSRFAAEAARLADSLDETADEA